MIRHRHNHLLCILPFLMLAKDTGGGVATAPAPKAATGESPAPAPQPAPGGAPQPKVHPKLLSAIQGYDENIQKAESYYIEMIELVLTEKISRADVVATLMRARGITFESAQSQYSRMKNIWANPDILAKLKSGEITLKVAREMTTKKQATAGAEANATSNSAATTKSNETKEARYERMRKGHVAAVKECGFDKKSAILSFDADLSAASVK